MSRSNKNRITNDQTAQAKERFNASVTLYNERNYTAAINAATRSIELYRKLYNFDSMMFTTKFADSLSNLGIIFSELGDNQKALHLFKETMHLYQNLLFKRFSINSIVNLAKSMINVSTLLGKVGEPQEALKTSESAVMLYRALLADNPINFISDLAFGLNELGNQLSACGELERALLITEEAVDLYQKLYEAKPTTVDSHLAISLMNFGSRLSRFGRFEKALQVTEQSVKLWRELCKSNSIAFASNLAQALSNLGNRLSELGKREESLQATTEAVAIFRTLHNDSPKAFADDLARSLNNLASCLSNLGHRQCALEVAKEVVSLYKNLYQVHPKAFAANFAKSLMSLGLKHFVLDDLQHALDTMIPAVNLYGELHQAHPEAFAIDFASGLSSLGAILHSHGDFNSSLKILGMAEALYHDLHKVYPGIFTADMAQILANRAIVLSSKGDLSSSVETMAQAVRLYRELCLINPSAYVNNLVKSLNSLGVGLSDFLKNETAAQDAHREAANMLVYRVGSIKWEPFTWLHQVKICTTALSSSADLHNVHLRSLEMLLDMRLSPLYNTNVSQAIISLKAHLIADLWRKLGPALEQDSELLNDVLPAIVSALQSPDLQRWLIEKGKDSPEAAAVAEAEAAVRRASNEVHLILQRLRGDGSDNMGDADGGMNLRSGMNINPFLESKLQEQLKQAEQQAQRARQALHDCRNALAEVDPAFAAAYRALSADDLIILLNELKQSAAPHRASAEAPAALLCLLDIPANGGTPAAIVGMLVTSDGLANRIQAVDFPGLHSLAQDCARYTPIGQRSCEVLRRQESESISSESIHLSFSELITQLETTWWKPLQQALRENANTLGMLHICTHGMTHHLPFAAVSAFRSDGNLALFQWPGLPYLRLAHTLKQARSATELSTTTWPNGLWQIGHDCAWTDRVPLPMAAVEASLLHRLMQANLSNKPIPSVETVTEPTQLNAQSAGLVLCAHGSGAQADDTHVRMTNGHLSTREVLERGLAPHLVLLPVCHAGQSADDAHGNALGLAAGFLLAGAGVVVGSSKPVPDTYMLWFTSLLLWYVRQGLSAYEAATRARTDFGAGNFPEDYKVWVRSELTEALAVLHPDGAEYQGVKQMQAEYQQRCKTAQIAGQPLPHYPLEGMIKDWPWAGFREAALPLATTNEGVRQKALNRVAALTFEDKPNSQTAAIMREMAAFIVVCGLG